jgi:WD40 repeat protein/transcriptional regulator with XRE-family HTH domain
VGRPERPLDPEAGPVQRLAHELRELRRAGGNPSYQTMAVTAGFSATTLSRAANGERLPSLDVLRGYVRACGGDPGEWEPRWKEAEAAGAEAVREEARDASPPYRGLARFEPGDRHLFFGREAVAQELIGLVSDHRLAVLFGASGSGKSSLLRAGLIPRLQERIAGGGSPAVLRILAPGARPAATYGHLLAPTEGEPECWVVVDQFEEVFTLCRDQAERTRFIDLLLAARAPDSRLRVLIAVRADFYARCLEHRGLADALRGAGLGLGPMSADELREAVVGPAAATGLLVERELTARIVEEVLDEPGALPMLSHALLETWRRRRSRMLTLAAYEATGGVRGAIAATAEEAYGRLSPDQAGTARQLLLRMVEPGRGAPDTRRPLTRTELDEWADPEVPPVVEALARARLLTADGDGVQLTHEALLTCWPRLAGWLEEDRERLAHHRRLTEAARVWAETDRDPGALYRGTRLDRAQELFTHDGALTAPERAFLTAALEARDAERRTAVRAARRSRVLLMSLSAVLAVALVAGLTAWSQHRANDRQRIDAAARRVAAVADSLRTTDPRAAMLLGAAAWRTSALPETRRALFDALAQPELDAFTDPTPGNGSNDFLADSGRTLLGVNGRTWRTWSVATHRRTASGTLPAATQAFAAGPGGRVLALFTDDGIRLWDTARDRWTGEARPLPRASTDIAFGSSGRSYLVSDSRDDRVQLRSLTGGRLLYETRAAGEANVAPSPDDRYVAVCAAGKAPQVWDTHSHRTLPGAWSGDGGLCDEADVDVVFGAGSGAHRFAVVSAAGVHVWDTRTGRQVAALDDAEVTSAVLSADGAFLATADGTQIKVWRLSATDTPVLSHSLDEQQAYGTLAWDPGHATLRYLAGGTVHSFDTTTATTSAWRTRALDGVLLAPDGHTLATAERTGSHYRFELRDTRAGHAPRILPSVPLADSAAPVMAFSPDGRAFAYGVSARRITVWDLPHARALTTLDLAPAGSTEGVAALALATGGHTLYAARPTDDGQVVDEVWDTTAHRRRAVLAGLASTHLTLRADGRLLVGDNHAARLPAGPSTTVHLVDGEQIAALAFAADGSRLAASDLTGGVALWDGDLRHRAGVLPNAFPSSPADSPETVSTLALSPDGRTLAVGGDQGTLQLWDTQTRQPLGAPLRTPGDAIGSLAFAADNRTLYAAGAHVALQRYAIDPAQAVRQVCARAGVGLTRAQWKTYAPEAAPVCPA